MSHQIWYDSQRIPGLLAGLHDLLIESISKPGVAYKGNDGEVRLVLPSKSQLLCSEPEVVEVYVQMYAYGPRRTYCFRGPTVVAALETATSEMARYIREDQSEEIPPGYCICSNPDCFEIAIRDVLEINPLCPECSDTLDGRPWS